MAITAITGPQVVFGLTQTTSGAVQEYNGERGPSLYDLGYAVADPRPFYAYQPGSPVGSKVVGFYNGAGSVDYAPSAVSTSALFVSTVSTALGGTTLTLAAQSSGGAVSTTITAPESGLTVSVIALGSTTVASPQLAFGSDATVAVWNPAAGTGRCITISPTSNLDTGTWTITGRDMYGYLMSETIVSSGGVKTSQKAFKYISAITASTTITSTGLQIGISDTFGFPLLLSRTGPDTYYNVGTTSSAAIIASTGAVTLGATATATSTTGDVRGTYVSTTATNGTLRIVMRQNFQAAGAFSVSASDTSGFFGVTQFSSV